MLTRRKLVASGLAGIASVGFARQGTWAALQLEATPAATPAAAGRILIAPGSPVVNGSFVNPLVEYYGEIEIGQRSYIAGNTILYAAEGQRVSLGNENNVQDNVYILANDTYTVFSDRVSVAHQAIIEDSEIGDFTFFGFKSRTRNAVIGEGAMIMHGTTVEGVTIPPNVITPVGVQILTQADADALPTLEEANEEFKNEVQGVNLEFVTGYTQMYEELGRSALERVGPNPLTSWNPAYVEPTLGDGVTLAELVRIVGDVRLGAESSVGQRTAIRADEGSPITIGRRARIESRTTFHALKGSSVSVGDNVIIGDGNVIHGPVTIGDNFRSEDDVVVFQATVESNVTVRQGALIVGAFTVREGTLVPEFSVVTSQEEADALPRL